MKDTLTDSEAAVQDITESDRRGLLEHLEEVPDPRDPRGIRYPLASLLAIAVCAVMAGAVTFAAIGDWIENLPQAFLAEVGLTSARPVNTTLWRVLTRVDSVALSAALAAWLLNRESLPGSDSPDGKDEDTSRGQDHDPDPETEPARRVVPVDGKAVRKTVRPDGHYVHLPAAYDVTTGITLGHHPQPGPDGRQGR